MTQIIRAGSQTKVTPPPGGSEIPTDKSVDEMKRDYNIITSFFQSMVLNINQLDKNVEYMKQFKDLERNLIMTLVIMMVRKFDLQMDEFAELYNNISGTPISEELLKILFEETIDEGSTKL